MIFHFFLNLFAAFGQGRFADMIMLTVPLALVGGFDRTAAARDDIECFQCRWLYCPFFGVATQNGVIMLSNLNRRRASQTGNTEPELNEAVRRGACKWWRPVHMTAAVATLGLLPAALPRSIGSGVQRPLATDAIARSRLRKRTAEHYAIH